MNPNNPQVRLPQDPDPYKGKTIPLGLKGEVKAEAVHKALDEIFRLGGCTGCGLLGFDLKLVGPRPEPWQQQLGKLEQIEGIRFVEVEQNMQR